ncbi:MFS transporter [Parathalassolituus penaei]|uniref:MFS transporter n=1 Tax=Parathalassolituus penaei TaxID=2997323 RepID=A0A9X3EB87_9GAMM|nr:MFS transporter [Parathalassolituus penaei]MCY0964050.1 MFS transporter [Parathalassolituus penaei]
MPMTPTFAINQIISHGFGLFLFVAMVPLMQGDVNFSHWHLASAGALTQIAYLSGAVLLGAMMHRLNSGTVLLATAAVTTTLLFSMMWVQAPEVILAMLAVMAFTAAISWGAIVELSGRYGQPQRRATGLSIAASGTAWGYSINGLLILVIVPWLGWRAGWLVAGLSGGMCMLLTWLMLRRVMAATAVVEGQSRSDSLSSAQVSDALPMRRLLLSVLCERTSAWAFWLLFMVGLTTIPFSTWLNTWFAEQSLPADLGGYTWTVIGLTGMVSGLLMGKLADHKGHAVALLLMTLLFALGMFGLIIAPANAALLAGLGYGLMYFPIWGVIGSWVGNHYSPKAAMQISGLGMVAFGAGGASGNLLAGAIQQITGNLSGLYQLIAVGSLILVVMALVIYSTERTLTPAGA